MKRQISIRLIVDRNATAAAVTARLEGRTYAVTGSSKREKGDVFDPVIGSTLATARALRELAAQMEARASALVEEAAVDKIVALVRRTETIGSRLAAPKPRPSLSIQKINEVYGLEAAQRAVRRRGTGFDELLESSDEGK